MILAAVLCWAPVSCTGEELNGVNNESDNDNIPPGFQGHFTTYFILMGCMGVVPFYLLATYVFSAAAPHQGIVLGAFWTVYGGLMSTICLENVIGKIGLPGNLIVPASWFLPVVLLVSFRKRFLQRPLLQHWLVGFQIFRVIGATFLTEFSRGKLSPIFSYAAGIGDVVVGVWATIVLLLHRKRETIPAIFVYSVIGLGMADFLSAFFFGFTSDPSDPLLFGSDASDTPVVFPIGLIPLYLVPSAIFFHFLSLLSQYMHGTVATKESRDLNTTKSSTKAGASQENVLETTV